jgi:hypothetical protein
MLSAPPPRPANGERIACRAVAQRRREVRGIRKWLFRRRVNSYNQSFCIALDCCEKRRRSLNAFDSVLRAIWFALGEEQQNKPSPSSSPFGKGRGEV